VEYLHERNIVYGIFSANNIYINKTRAFLGTKDLYEVNKDGAAKNF
jgi:hypothetical protein